MEAPTFRARRERLIVREIEHETLVYDLDRDRAHSLNATSSAVWKLCDGRHSAADIARQVMLDLGQQIDEETIWLALQQLETDHLLDGALPGNRPARISRRQMVRRMGLGAAVVAVPAITSIAVQTAAAHASACLPSGSPCSDNAQCCTGLCSGGSCA